MSSMKSENMQFNKRFKEKELIKEWIIKKKQCLYTKALLDHYFSNTKELKFRLDKDAKELERLGDRILNDPEDPDPELVKMWINKKKQWRSTKEKLDFNFSNTKVFLFHLDEDTKQFERLSDIFLEQCDTSSETERPLLFPSPKLL